MVTQGKEIQYINQIISYLTGCSEGANIHALANGVGLGRNIVARYLSILNLMGRLEMWTEGKTKVYRLAQRVPFYIFSLFPLGTAIGLNRSLQVKVIMGPVHETLGCKESDCIGRFVSELSHPIFQESGLRDQVLEAFNREESHGETHEYQIQGRVYEVSVAPCTFDDGTWGVTLLIRDLSHERDVRFEEHLLAERFRAVMRETKEFIVDLDADDRVIRVNDAFAQNVGITPSECIGKTGIPSVLNEDMLAIKRTGCQNSLLHEESPTMPVEVRVVMPDGAVHWHEWQAYPDYTDGLLTSLHCIGSDITNRKTQELLIHQYESGLSAIVEEKTKELREVTGGLRKEIDERRRIEADLKLSEENHRRLIETTNDIIWETGEEHQFTAISPSSQEIFGYDPEMLIGRHFFDIIDDSVADGRAFDFVSLLITGEPFDRILTPIRRCDASPIWIDVSGVPKKSLDTCFHGYYGVARDCTERVLKEEMLEELQAIIVATPDIIAITEEDGSLRYLNPAGKSFFGIAPDSDISRINFFTYIFQNDPDEYQNKRKEAIATGSWRGETIMRNTAGNPTPMSQIINYHHRRFPQRSFYSTIARDISERFAYEEELAQAYEYTRTLIEVSPDPLVTIGSDGKIQDVNTATEKVTGVLRERLIGTNFSKYFLDPEKAEEGYNRVFSEGSVKDYQLEILHRNGTKTPVLYNAVVYRDDTGKVRGVFAAAREISATSVTSVQSHPTEGQRNGPGKPPPKQKRG
ncbi:MAG TPA: PAS domain S-box protein [Methanospirillum sp.]|nr:PAS domain S-box protein [Methanospirillum sp.]